jgi:hypothetical protein
MKKQLTDNVSEYECRALKKNLLRKYCSIKYGPCGVVKISGTVPGAIIAKLADCSFNFSVKKRLVSEWVSFLIID